MTGQQQSGDRFGMVSEVKDRVAIIGAGPGGIVAAKFLADDGLLPVVFDQSDRAGGQWHSGNSMSGIWTGMPTNTSRIMTHFSDLDYPQGTPAFPLSEEVHRYLLNYIDVFELQRFLKLNCEVTDVSRLPSGHWQLSYQDAGGEHITEAFSRVIIASGRFNQAIRPAVVGLPDSDNGAGSGAKTRLLRVSHAFDYSGPDTFKDQRVVVAGGAISALEIACDLALSGALKVTSCYRGQRYVLGKLAVGVPTDHLNFSLYEALAGERLPPDQLAENMKAFILSSAGNPADFGAFEPNSDVRLAGVTKCEHFLPLVQSGRISVRPWIERIEQNTVIFSDGHREIADALIFATGYRLSLPFLPSEISESLSLDEEHIALYKHSFHPALPGLAVLGFYNQVGPYFPILELQARWIAAVFSGRISLPEQQEMEQGLAAYYDSWKLPQKMPMHKLALLFGRAIGAEPAPDQWPAIRRAIWFGPLSASVFRLSGLDSCTDAEQAVIREAQAFGLIENEQFSSEELQKLKSILQDR